MAECAHCNVSILDPTTQVVHGDMTFCCSSCAAGRKQHGSGSDPQQAHTADLRCGHRGVAIVDESIMASRGDTACCCANCAMATVAPR
jgi:hypothetical protein